MSTRLNGSMVKSCGRNAILAASIIIALLMACSCAPVACWTSPREANQAGERLEPATAEWMDRNILSVPEGQILVLRKGEVLGALQILKIGDSNVEGKWWGSRSRPFDFRNDKAETGSFALVESYEEIPMDKLTQEQLPEGVRLQDIAPGGPDDVFLVDKGSVLEFQFCGFQVEWSYPNWLYLPRDTEFWLTQATTISEMDPSLYGGAVEKQAKAGTREKQERQ